MRSSWIKSTWGALPVKVSRSEVSSTTTGKCSKQDFPQKGIEKLLGSGHVHANITAWSCDMEGYAKKCLEHYCELANTNIEQFYDVSTVSTITSSRRRNWKRWEKCQKSAPKSVKCPYLARISGYSVVCQRTGKSSYDIKQIRIEHCHEEHIAGQCRFGFLEDSDCPGTLKIRIRRREAFNASSEVERSYQSVDVQVQTSVSHCSTESEILSLDAGQRMGGLLALDLPDVVIDVLGSTNSTKNTNCHAVPPSRR